MVIHYSGIICRFPVVVYSDFFLFSSSGHWMLLSTDWSSWQRWVRSYITVHIHLLCLYDCSLVLLVNVTRSTLVKTSTYIGQFHVTMRCFISYTTVHVVGMDDTIYFFCRFFLKEIHDLVFREHKDKMLRKLITFLSSSECRRK